jgi:hypothetical protein
LVEDNGTVAVTVAVAGLDKENREEEEDGYYPSEENSEGWWMETIVRTRKRRMFVKFPRVMDGRSCQEEEEENVKCVHFHWLLWCEASKFKMGNVCFLLYYRAKVLFFFFYKIMLILNIMSLHFAN